MKINVIKKPNGDLSPATQSDKDVVKKWTPGDWIVLDAKRPRSGPQHRFYFSMLRMVYDNSEWAQDRWPRFENFREAIQIAAGHYETRYTWSGEEQLVPKSVSFARMGQDEFSELLQQVKDIVLRDVWPNMTDHELTIMVEEFQRMEVVA